MENCEICNRSTTALINCPSCGINFCSDCRIGDKCNNCATIKRYKATIKYVLKNKHITVFNCNLLIRNDELILEYVEDDVAYRYSGKKVDGIYLVTGEEIEGNRIVGNGQIYKTKNNLYEGTWVQDYEEGTWVIETI